MTVDHERAMGIAESIWQHVEQDRRERGSGIPLADYEILAEAYRDIYAQLEATERYADMIAAVAATSTRSDRSDK